MSRSCSSKIIFCLNNIRWESLWFISFEAYSDEGLHLLILKHYVTSKISQREKCPNTEFFLVRIFPNLGKYRPEKTPYLDTFHAVYWRSSHRRYSLKKLFLKYFAILTGKYLCWILLLIKLQVLRTAT